VLRAWLRTCDSRNPGLSGPHDSLTQFPWPGFPDQHGQHKATGRGAGGDRRG